MISESRAVGEGTKGTNIESQPRMEAYRFAFINHAGEFLDFRNKVILEIGCRDGKMLKEIVDKYNPEYAVGLDINLNFYNVKPLKENNWELIECDARRISFPDNCFDIVISDGVFEHMQDLSKCLNEIKRVLKPCGKLYSEIGPIWSSVTGHHFNPKNEEEAKLIPPWGHLWMDELSLMKHLSSKVGKEKAEQIYYDVYRSGHINRLKWRDYYDAFLNSGFIINRLRECTTAPRFFPFGRWDNEMTQEIADRIKEYQLNELYTWGFILLFEKPV